MYKALFETLSGGGKRKREGSESGQSQSKITYYFIPKDKIDEDLYSKIQQNFEEKRIDEKERRSTEVEVPSPLREILILQADDFNLEDKHNLKHFEDDMPTPEKIIQLNQEAEEAKKAKRAQEAQEGIFVGFTERGEFRMRFGTHSTRRNLIPLLNYAAESSKFWQFISDYEGYYQYLYNKMKMEEQQEKKK